ncbi:hypothetical protein FACS189496_5140 [Bacilli bacterium]|nr:hypothetical protein FACS189496_5140 [Bacilli bacterium]
MGYIKKNGDITFEEAQKIVDENNKKIVAMLVVNDVSFLKKGGRVSNAKAFFVSLLKLNILISMYNDGLNFYDKSKSIDAIPEKIIKYFTNTNPGAKIEKLGYINLGKSNKSIIENVKNLINVKNVEVSKCCSAVIAHTGPDISAILVKYK